MKRSMNVLALTLALALALAPAAQAASWVISTVQRTWLAHDNTSGGGLNEVVNNGYLKIYTGSSPGPNNSPTGTLLVTLTLPAKASNSVANGVLTFGSIAQQNAVADGAAGYFRIFRSDGSTCVGDGDVGASGASINLNTTSIVSGGPVSITSLTIAVPAGT